MPTIKLTVTDEACGARLDAYVAAHETQLSRAQVQQGIRAGWLTVNGQPAKAAYRVHVGDRIELSVPAPQPAVAGPEPIPLQILYEDDWIVVIDKPAGLVVHPGSGNPAGTLVNALLHHCPRLSGVGGVVRPGIVHRLDKDTSGVMVAAKNDLAHRGLAAQFSCHSVDRRYRALVFGVMEQPAGTISAAVGRDRVDRKRMTTRTRAGRQAVTHWRVLTQWEQLSLVEARLETGRTHQVRVHFASIGHGLVGDPVYGSSRRIRNLSGPKPVCDVLRGVNRQLLHAGHLGFAHPATARRMVFQTPVPDDFRAVLDVLENGSCLGSH